MLHGRHPFDALGIRYHFIHVKFPLSHGIQTVEFLVFSFTTNGTDSSLSDDDESLNFKS